MIARAGVVGAVKRAPGNRAGWPDCAGLMAPRDGTKPAEAG